MINDMKVECPECDELLYSKGQPPHEAMLKVTKIQKSSEELRLWCICLLCKHKFGLHSDIIN